jgi:glutathione synthase/RimK-type ligase-like ATP-grasp enzyme
MKDNRDNSTGKEPLAGSKWGKWRLVHDTEPLKDCQPLTCPYTTEYLDDFLNLFPTVFLKPDDGYGGKDVIRVQREGETLLALHDADAHEFAGIAELDTWLTTVRGDRPFLLQQGIDLMPYKGKLVDMRTILQKQENGCWLVTGMFAKAAKPGMVVTNVKAGGVPFRVPVYLRGCVLGRSARKRVLKEMVKLSVAVAEVFERSYSNTLYGLDLALDRDGKLWLIEVNTRPSILILREIDRKMFEVSARMRWPNRGRRIGNRL